MNHSLSTNSQIIILAAGNGTRMQSKIPKVLHLVGERTMIDRVIENSSQVTDDIILVHSNQLLGSIQQYQNRCKFILQEPPKGTAHAVYLALPLINTNKVNAVIFGDNPLITPKLINELISKLVTTNSALITLAFQRSNPAQYGRIITDKSGNFLKIVEFKFANAEEKNVTLCNSGIMAFAPGILNKYLSHSLQSDRPEGKEFYLTELVEICKNHNEQVTYLLAQNSHEVVGVNTKEELIEANNIYCDFNDKV